MISMTWPLVTVLRMLVLVDGPERTLSAYAVTVAVFTTVLPTGVLPVPGVVGAGAGTEPPTEIQSEWAKPEMPL